MDRKISLRQATALLLTQGVGVACSIIPALSLGLCGRDGLIALVLAGIIAAFYSFVILSTINRTKLYKPLRWLFIVKALLLAGLLLRYVAETIIDLSEGETGLIPVMALMTLAVVYCASKGRKVSARLSEILLIPLWGLILFVLFSSAIGGRLDFKELLPIGETRGSVIILSAFKLSLWFYPLDYILINFPYIENRERLKKTIPVAMIIMGLFFALIFAFNLMRMGLRQMSSLGYRSLTEMMYSVTLPYSFIERQEGLMLGIITLGGICGIGGLIEGAAIASGEAFKGFSEGKTALLCGIAAFIIGAMPFKNPLNRAINIVTVLGGIWFILLLILHLFKGKKMLFALSLCLFLTACGTEPEERSFVSAMGIDINEGKTELCLLSAEGVAAEEENEKNRGVIRAEGKSLGEAIEKCELYSSGNLYFGHTGLIILSESLVKNKENIKYTAEFIRENTEISRRAIILVADKPSEILENQEENHSVWDFVREHYTAHKHKKPYELDYLLKAIAEKGDSLIPVIHTGRDSMEISGGAVIKKGSLAGVISEEELKAVSLITDMGFEPVIYRGEKGYKINSVKIKTEPYKITLKIKGDKQANSLVLNRAEKGLEIMKKFGCDFVDMEKTCNAYRVEYDPNREIEAEVK